jgi:hypothetical protein
MGGAGREGTEREIAYSPLPSQASVSRFDGPDEGVFGPIGSGKSQALCHEAIRLTYLNPGRPGLIGAPTYPMLRDATQQALFEILNSNRIPFDYSKAENILVMKDTGSRESCSVRSRSSNDCAARTWRGSASDELTYAPEAAWLRLEFLILSTLLPFQIFNFKFHPLL